MFDFKYVHFNTLAETLNYLETYPDCCIIAGGTDVMVQYRAGKISNSSVVDVLLPELIGICEDREFFHIGASTTLADVSVFFARLEQPYRMLHFAAESVGSCQTRNLGTIGGNICTGNASSDMATALLSADAAAVICSAKGVRRVPLDEFFIKNRVIALKCGELLKEILIPKVYWPVSGACFAKIGKRRGHVIATLNVAATICQDENGIIRYAKLAYGTMAPKPVRLYECEKVLLGCSAHGEELRLALKEISSVMLTEIQPRDSKRGSKEYRINAGTAVLWDAIMDACYEEE